jgi:hypothetical protein
MQGCQGRELSRFDLPTSGARRSAASAASAIRGTCDARRLEGRFQGRQRAPRVPRAARTSGHFLRTLGGGGDGPSRQQGPSDHRAANATKALLPEMSRPFACRCTIYQSAIRRWVPLSAPAAMTANEKALTKPMRGPETAEAAQNPDFGKELVSRPLGRSRGP